MKERNNLYPIFLKTQQLNILIVGGGYVALEKLTFLLKSSPNANIEMVAPFFREETLDFIKDKKVKTINGIYLQDYLKDKHMVIATTDDELINEQVYHDCRARNILVNVADNPPFCDFYMGGIVTKGNVKVAISSHTDSRGSASANLQLSEQRAKAVANYLISKGINASRLVAKGFGETRLKNRCSDGLSCTEQEHAVNRRTEFRVLNF